MKQKNNQLSSTITKFPSGLPMNHGVKGIAATLKFLDCRDKQSLHQTYGLLTSV